MIELSVLESFVEGEKGADLDLASDVGKYRAPQHEGEP
jgi:hypothetical protein